LAAAHAAGILHRDIKPATTVAGEFYGTPAYTSPEQARGDVDPHRFRLDGTVTVAILEIPDHCVENCVGGIGKQASLHEIGPVLPLHLEVFDREGLQFLVGRQPAVGLGPPPLPRRSRQRIVVGLLFACDVRAGK
jgi:hypothetical protein